MVSGNAFSWCFCFLLSRMSSCCCCCCRFPSLVKIGDGSKSSSFGRGDCACCGSKFDNVLWDGEWCRGCLLVGWSRSSSINLLCGGSWEGGRGDGVGCSGKASHFGGGDNILSLISRELDSNNFGFFLRKSLRLSFYLICHCGERCIVLRSRKNKMGFAPKVKFWSTIAFGWCWLLSRAVGTGRCAAEGRFRRIWNIGILQWWMIERFTWWGGWVNF